MIYRIARNGQVVGTFTLAQLRQEIAARRLAPDDLAQADGAVEWLPVTELFGGSLMLDDSPAITRLYPDPPDLRWWIALLLGAVTLGAFFVVWDVVQAAWLRRVERSSVALILYCLALVVFVVNAPAQWASINHALFNGPLVAAPFALWLSLGAVVTRLAARFVMRSELLRHFTTVEPLGLQLNGFLTLLLGGLYFQYHFNKINDAKRNLRISVPGN